MSSSDRLLLILHVGFAIFTLGPLTAATMATPRQIRNRNVHVLRYLMRATRIYGLSTLGMLLFGIFLAHGRFEPWLVVSITLFVVALVLLLIVDRDQHRAAHKLELAAAQAAPATGTAAGTAVEPARATAADAPTAEPVGSGAGDGKPAVPAESSSADSSSAASGEAAEAAPAENQDAPATATSGQGTGTATGDQEIAQVEQGRIAALSGVISLIWIVTLFLMVWYS